MTTPIWVKIIEMAPISPEGLRAGTNSERMFPVPVIGIAEILDIKVVEASIDGDGHLDVSVEPVQIVVSNRVMGANQRFTIARELGHLCLGHEFDAQEGSPERDWISERQAHVP